jgi:hypothetical protein
MKITSDRCRQRAAEFDRKAERATEDEGRKFYYELAEEWRDLAEHLEEFEARQNAK